METLRMKPLDAIWLMMESDDTPMHVGVLAIFEKPRRAAEDYLGQWADEMRRFRHPVAPWSHSLARGWSAAVSPRLVEEQDFDLDYHFRHSALAQPGGERELGLMVSRLHSNALDRTRPLWEFHLIEGLERDRFAFYVKVHHALIDNVNAIPLLLSQLSESVSQRKMPPLWAQPLASGWHEPTSRRAFSPTHSNRRLPWAEPLPGSCKVLSGASRRAPF
jgi:WS/DGAT/MGAT family acyltransferase